MAKYEPKGIVWGKKKESVWPAVVAVVIVLTIIGAAIG